MALTTELESEIRVKLSNNEAISTLTVFELLNEIDLLRKEIDCLILAKSEIEAGLNKSALVNMND